MKNKSPLAPRNPLVAPARFKKAGAHEKSGKARRRADKMALNTEIRAAKNGGFSGAEYPTKCRVATVFRRAFHTRPFLNSDNNKENTMQQEIIREFLEQSRAYFGLAEDESEPQSRIRRVTAWWANQNRLSSMRCCLN